MADAISGPKQKTIKIADDHIWIRGVGPTDGGEFAVPGVDKRLLSPSLPSVLRDGMKELGRETGLIQRGGSGAAATFLPINGGDKAGDRSLAAKAGGPEDTGFDREDVVYCGIDFFDALREHLLACVVGAYGWLGRTRGRCRRAGGG